MKPGFGDWLAGFSDGEGCFLIAIDRRSNRHACSFKIGLRQDDRPILDEIQRETGIGAVYVERRGIASWTVSRKDEVVRLVEIFDRHPLRAKKRRDYEIWRRAVDVWVRRTRIRPRGDESPLARLTDDQVAEIRRRVAGGERQVELAAEFGASQSHLSKIVNGRARPGREDVDPWAEMRSLRAELQRVRREAVA